MGNSHCKEGNSEYLSQIYIQGIIQGKIMLRWPALILKCKNCENPCFFLLLSKN